MLESDVLLLLNDYIYPICKRQKGLSSIKDEKPVVPPLLAVYTATLSVSKIIPISYNDEIDRQSLLLPNGGFGLGLGSPFPIIHTLICTDHQLS